MISALSLQKALEGNIEALTKILVCLGCPEEYIKYNESKHMITSVRPEDGADNKLGLLIYTDSLYYMYTTRNGRGSIFNLVMDVKHCVFPKALEYVERWTGIKGKQHDVKYPFDGFYRHLLSEEGEVEDRILDEYDEDRLPTRLALSQTFLDEGISLQCQEKWGVRYDLAHGNVLIPVYDAFGRLVGCKARSDDPNVAHDKRWFAYLPYSKTAVVYGYSQNYAEIQKKNMVVVFESEKSVLQCDSMGFHAAVAIGGHNLSRIQEHYIKNLMTDKIILAFDEDILEDEMIYWAKRLKSDRLMKNHVGYIIDPKHEYLGAKDSPSDHGKQVFEALLKHNIKWIGE